MLLVLQVRFRSLKLITARKRLSGFDYRFDSLNVIEEPTELNKAFSTLFHAENKPGIYDFVTAFVPSLRILVCHFAS